jgi:peptidyl-prolyl cis-trans isomerase B (cyclophilin B)
MRDASHRWFWGIALAFFATLTGCGQQKAADEAQPKPAAIQGPSPAARSNSVAAGAAQAGIEFPKIPAPFEKATRPAPNPHPQVVMETSLGKITLTLDALKADRTTANFLRHVNQGDYDNTVFHQVYQGYAALGGSYTPEGGEKAAGPDTVFNQASNGLRNMRGTIALARSPEDAHSGSMMFFINLADNPQLDFKDTSSPENWGYCVFGQVTAGMEEVVDRIAAVPLTTKHNLENTPTEPVIIKKIRRIN